MLYLCWKDLFFLSDINTSLIIVTDIVLLLH